ncbi:MAG: hypothetical protein E4G92_06635 [Bacteroidia bacterium]|nr:MAG: hypothetical protein E4G92_06635 [Bacteroidia bacterium]
MNMKRFLSVVLSLILLTSFSGCRKTPPVNRYPLGHFPDSVMALEGLNTQYDDYNSDLNEYGILTGSHPLVFSSNRETAGGTFNLVYGEYGYYFGQTSGFFQLHSEISSDPFLDALTAKFNTSGNDFGPFRFLNRGDGLEYMATATEVSGTGLDIVFSCFTPSFSNVPPIPDPVPATLFNTSSDDAYISLNINFDTAYFCSDRSGNFDIYLLKRPPATNINTWFLSPSATPVAIDSITTMANEKCPYVSGRYMVFVSDRPGGMGGYDIYYAVFRGGKWSSPVNMGPKINSEYNEYRPVIGKDNLFDGPFMVFSSDRPGGKGGYDLYFTGITFR